MLAAKEYRYLSPVAIIRKTDRKLVAIHSAALTNKPAIVAMQPIVNRVDPPPEDAKDRPLALLRAELDLGPEAGPEEVLLAANERFVELRREAQRRHVEERVREAIQAGKLVEAQRRWAEALVAREEELFDEWLRTTPVVVALGASTPPESGEGPERGQGAIAAKARAEFRAHGILSGLTTEEAYVADALRGAQRRCA
jgi:phage I-like protein